MEQRPILLAAVDGHPPVERRTDRERVDDEVDPEAGEVVPDAVERPEPEDERVLVGQRGLGL